MARPLRIEYAGAVYHVMARGNQGRAIFRDDRDRQRFLETVGEAGFFEKLKTRLETLMAGKQRESHRGGARRAHGAAAAKQLLTDGLATLGLSPGALRKMAKGAPEKTVLAWWLRKRTAVSLRWVGEALAMGQYTRVGQAVSRLERKPGKKLERLKRKLLESEQSDA